MALTHCGEYLVRFDLVSEEVNATVPGISRRAADVAPPRGLCQSFRHEVPYAILAAPNSFQTVYMSILTLCWIWYCPQSGWGCCMGGPDRFRRAHEVCWAAYRAMAFGIDVDIV